MNPFSQQNPTLCSPASSSDLVFPVLPTVKMEVGLPARHPAEEGAQGRCCKDLIQKRDTPWGRPVARCRGVQGPGCVCTWFSGRREMGPRERSSSRSLGPFPALPVGGGRGKRSEGCEAGAASCPKGAYVAVSFHLFARSQCQKVAGRYQVGGQGHRQEASHLRGRRPCARGKPEKWERLGNTVFRVQGQAQDPLKDSELGPYNLLSERPC